jgi:HEAT repeat protein
MGLFGPPNVEKMTAKRDIKGLIKALGYEQDSSIREAAAAALGEIGDAGAVEPLTACALRESDTTVRVTAESALVKIGAPAVEPLSAALKDSDYRVRKVAADTLGRIGMSSVEPLISALKDDHFDVRLSAAGALGQIGDDRALKPLIGALNDRNNTVRSAVASALGQIGDSRAVEPLIGASKDRNNTVRSAVAGALGQIGDARAVEPLIAALKDGDNNVRLAAASALGQIGDARAVEPLIVALADPDGAVPQKAADALDIAGWRPGGNENGAAYWVARRRWDKCIEIGTPAVGKLIAAFKHSDSIVRSSAADALVRIGAPTVVPLIAALKDGESKVREAAASTLPKIGQPAVAPLIAALKDSDSRVRLASASALGQIGDLRAVVPLIAALTNSGSGVGEMASLALDKMGWRPGQDQSGAAYWVAKRRWDKCIEIGAPAVDPLLAVSKNIGDSYRGVRQAAGDTLTKIGQPAVKPLIAALKDGSSVVRLWAAIALGQIGDARAVDPLIAALADSSHSVGNSASYALDRMGWRPGQDQIGATYWVAKQRWEKCIEIGAPAVEPLVAALKGRETFSLHLAVTDALDKIGWRPGPDEVGAAYWVARGEWNNCLESGAAAVEPLIVALFHGPLSARRAKAELLVLLYQSDLLDEAGKALILAQKRAITSIHTDQSHHDEGVPGRNSDCTHQDYASHTDTGIGGTFPI